MSPKTVLRQGARAAVALRRHPLAAAVLLGLAAMPAARAATIVVTTGGDTNPAATTTCTLRQAVLSMNTSTLSGNCANTGAAFGTNNTINFAPAISTIALANVADNELHVTAANLAIDAGVGRTVTIERPAAATHAFPLIRASGASLGLTGLMLKNGSANSETFYDNKYFANAGGAIYASSDLTLTRCSIVGSTAPDWGGGVYVNGHALTIRDSTISGNDANFGGGITVVRGRLTMLESTVSGNVGGAMTVFRTPVYLRNTTLSGNTSDNIAKYGRATAIAAYNKGEPLTIVSSTIACNDGPLLLPNERLTAILLLQPNTTLVNTVLANTANQRCATTVTSDIDVKTLSSPVAIHGANNLVLEAGQGVTFDSPPLTGDPLLQPLADNGGPTLTHALSLGSPALNAGANPTGIAFDQRGTGFARESGVSADIGAFEVQSPTFCGSAHRQSFSNLTSASPNLCGAGTVLVPATLLEGISASSRWTWLCGVPPDYLSLSGCFAWISTTTTLSIRNTSDVPVASAVYGQPLRLRPTVAGQYTGSGSAPAAPTGSVSFYDATGVGLDAICTNVPLATFCSPPTGAPSLGTRKLQAIYNGDTRWGKSSSALQQVVIQPATSTTGIASRVPNPVPVRAPFTVTAQVQVNAPSLATPSGEIEVLDQTDNLSCTYDLAAPVPGCAITPNSAGTHALRVTYLGDGSGNITGSQATGTETVQPATTTTSIASRSPNPVALGASFTVVAQVLVVAPSQATPTGVIEVLDETDGLSCSYNLAAPVPGCAITPVSGGTHALRVTYLGDGAGNITGSQATGTETVSAPAAVTDARTLLEDAIPTAIDVLVNDTALAGGAKLVQSASDPAHGTVVVTGGGTGLTYQPDANYCDTTPDTFSYVLNGGSSATVGVTVTCVNDPPSFTIGANQTVFPGARSVTGWATAISPGPANESGQAVSFEIVANPNPLLFGAGSVVVAPDGTLSYTATNAGEATITLRAVDDGGGVTNASAPQGFTIVVLPQPADALFANGFE